MNIAFALAKKTTASVRKYSRDFGHNRERDLFGCFAADVQSGRRE
jgi:hypothetical protein